MFAFVRSCQQDLSYKRGFASGARGQPFKYPRWADTQVYGLAYVDGRKVFLIAKAEERSSLKEPE
jgi:hypothetical protein